MEIYNEILREYFAEREFSLLDSDTAKSIVEGVCYKILMQIKYIIENKELSDLECFNAIEDIVCEFEKSGIKCSYRHDF